MFGKFFNPLKEKFEKFYPPYLEVKADRLIFETETERYLMVIKAKQKMKKKFRSFVVPIRPVSAQEGNFIFPEMKRLLSFVRELNFKVLRIDVNRSLDLVKPADLILKKRLFRKRIAISMAEAVYFNLGSNIPMRIRKDLFERQQGQLQINESQKEGDFQALFSARVWSDDFTNNEVIM